MGRTWRAVLLVIALVATSVAVGGPVAAVDDPASCPAPAGGWQRLAGADRYATAAATTAQLAAGVATVFVASGEDFADALGAGAAAGAAGTGLLLTRHDTLPEATRAELARLRPGRIVVVGGTTAVAPSVATALEGLTSGPVVRLAGADRYATAATLVGAAFPGTGGVAYLATGRDFADGLVAGSTRRPVLLADRDAVPAPTADRLKQLAPTTVVLVGGSNALSPAVEGQVRALLPGTGVERLAGVDRYATAVALGERQTGATRIQLTTSASFADALAAAPLGPVVLAPPAPPMPGSLVSFLQARPQAELVVVGGSAGVSDAAIAALRPGIVACLTVDRSSLADGQSSAGTVRLRAPAPPGGTVVSLSTSSSTVTLPATITVPAGERSASFTVRANGSTSSFTVTAAAGGATRSVQLTGSAPAQPLAPTISSFAASATILEVAQPTTLSWSTTGAVSCWIDNGVGAVPCTGTTTVTPGIDRTYRLLATTDAGGAAEQALAIDVGSPSRFVYASNNLDDTLQVFAMNPTTGALAAVGTPIATAADPYGMATDPAGRYLYLANFGTDTVASYLIDATTGALTANGPTVPTGDQPRAIAIDPSGRFLYVANQATTGTVSMFRIGSDGRLTSIGAAAAAGNQPTSITVDGTGRFAYATNGGGTTVQMYTINQTTGALSSIGGGTIAAQSGPVGIAADPAGRFLYVSNVGADSVSSYSINQTTGALTLIAHVGTPGVHVNGIDNPVGLGVDPSGRYLYVADGAGSTVSMFTINQTTGAMQSNGTAPTGGADSFALDIDASGEFLYVTNRTNSTAVMFDLDQSTGLLTPLAPATIGVGTSPQGLVSAR